MRVAIVLVLVALVCTVVADKHRGGRYHYRNNELYRACHQDRVAKCPDVHPPFTHQSLHSCFHDHWDELSEDCRAVLQKVHQHHTDQQQQQQQEEPKIDDQDQPIKTLKVVDVDNHAAVLKDQDNMPVHPEPLRNPETTTDETTNDVIVNHDLPDQDEKPHHRQHDNKHHGKHGKQHGKQHGKHGKQHGKHHGKQDVSSDSAEIALFWVIIIVGAIAAVALGLCCVCVSCCCCRRRNFRCKTAVAYVPIPVNYEGQNTQSFGKIIHAGQAKKDDRIALV